MTMLEGNGRPSAHLVGEVGQYYKDLETGDIYECRSANKFSPLHGSPVGGYVWERRATGENIREHGDIFGGGGSGASNGLADFYMYFDEAIDGSKTWHANMTGIEFRDHVMNHTLGNMIVRRYFISDDGYCTCYDLDPGTYFIEPDGKIAFLLIEQRSHDDEYIGLNPDGSFFDYSPPD